MNIGILETGDVATNLAAGLARAGHTIKLGSRDPAKARNLAGRNVSVGSAAEAAAFGDAVILAVPFTAANEAIQAAGPKALKGKVLVDAMNVFRPEGKASSTSGAEEVAALAPGARVVKAFNHVFAATMSTGKVGDRRLLALVAGDEAEAKRTVLRLAGDIGFDPVDAGPLTSARYMEAMALMNIRLAFELKMGTKMGLALARGD